MEMFLWNFIGIFLKFSEFKIQISSIQFKIKIFKTISNADLNAFTYSLFSQQFLKMPKILILKNKKKCVEDDNGPFNATN